MDTKDYVLGRLSKETLKQLEDTFDEVIHILEDTKTMTFDNVMNKYMNNKNIFYRNFIKIDEFSNHFTR